MSLNLEKNPLLFRTLLLVVRIDLLSYLLYLAQRVEQFWPTIERVCKLC